jgi:hypothetical protein
MRQQFIGFSGPGPAGAASGKKTRNTATTRRAAVRKGRERG